MISSDRNILVPGSAVAARMKEYGVQVGELHIVLMSDKAHQLKEIELSEKIWVYPTNSMASFLRPLDAAALGKRLVKKKGFVRGASLVTADSIEAGWAGLKVKKHWRLPLEVQVHTDIFSLFFAGFQNNVRKFFARKVLANADAVRVVSDELKQKVTPFVKKGRVFVLPIYVDRERIENARLAFDLHARYPWRFIMLAVARLTPEKNLGLAIETLALVHETFPDTGLVIVGEGPERKNLEALAHRLGVAGSVAFAGWQEDLTSYYKSANLFVQTSLFEGYGLSLVEAGLSHLPVVTTAVGVAKEFENGRDLSVVEPRADLFAVAITDLIEHNEKRAAMGLSLQAALERKLMPKEAYLKALSAAWQETAHRIS